jgi:hypothetical protein
VVAIGNFADRVALRTVDGTPIDFVVAPIFPADRSGWRRERAAQTARPEGTLRLIDAASARALAPETHTITYLRSDSDRLLVAGRVEGAAVTAELRRVKSDTFSFYPWLWRK